VQIARDPVSLLDGLLAFVPLRFGELGGGSPALADDGAQQERRQRRDGDVDLRAERPVVDGLRVEGSHVIGCDPDRHARRDRNRQRGALRAEPESRPDQGREDHVGHGLIGRDREHAQHDDRDHEGSALPAADAPPCGERIGSPSQHQR